MCSTQEQTPFAVHKDERLLKRPAPVLSYTWPTCVQHESTPFVTYEDGRSLSQPAPVSIMHAVRRMAKSRELHSATGATPLLSHANTAQKSLHIPWSAQPQEQQRKLLRIVSYACAAPSLWYTKTGDDSQNWHRFCDACAWWTAHGTAAFCTWADPLCDTQRQEVIHKTSNRSGIHTAGRVAQGPTVFYAWARPYARYVVRRMAEGTIVLLFHTHRQNLMRYTLQEEWRRGHNCAPHKSTTVFHHTDGRFLTRPALHWWCTQAEEWLRTRSHCEAWPSSHRGRHTWPEHG